MSSIMTIQNIIRAILKGFTDSLRGAVTLLYIDKQLNKEKELAEAKSAAQKKEKGVGTSPAKAPKNLKKSRVLFTTIQCSLWNLAFCGFVIAAFEYLFLPSVYHVLSIIFGLSNESWSSYIKPFIECCFSTLYIVPIFIISRVVNCIWFQDIAESAHRYSQERTVALTSISKFLADMMFSTLVQFMFLGQGILVSKVPIAPVGTILALIHMCLLHALYAFEYKWCNMGWELHRRLTFIEYNWPYFVGFGLPLTVLTQLPSSTMFSTCIFSVLFPLFIISGNQATPVTGACDSPLKLFSPVVMIANTLFNKIIGSKKR